MPYETVRTGEAGNVAILFITSTHIGDAILSSGLLHRLLQDYPEDSVTIACGAPAAKVFEAVPRLERIHTLRKRSYSRHWLDLWRATATRRWRVVVDLRRTLMPHILWAQEKHILPKPQAPIHRVDLISQTLSLPPLAPKVWTEERHERQAEALLGDGGDLVAVAPGATWIGKIWPAQNFVELAQRLLGSGGMLEGCRLLLIGADSERDAARPIREALPSSQVVDAMGTDVLTTYAALELCRLFVGNDSAMMHLAAATGRPTVGLFGPTNDVHYAPWGENGLVVRTPESIEELIGGSDYNTRTTGTIMANLTAEMVETAIRDRWGETLSVEGKT